MYLIGIDIGTSACKVTAFDLEGGVKFATSEAYANHFPHPGHVEQYPDEWWAAVCKALHRMLTDGGIAPAEIAGIGVDGQSWSAIAVDGDGNVLAPNPIWMDTRSEAICRETEIRVGASEIFAVAGNSLKPQYTTGKILWYKKHRPETYRKTNKILQCNSFIVYRLCGVMSHDHSQGYGLHCYDMQKKCWDRDMCRTLGIPGSFLPDLTESHACVGGVSDMAAAQTGLIAGTPVVAGGLDAACGTLGVGVIKDGQTQEQGGQAGGMSICMTKYAADPRLILSPHVTGNGWLLQGGTTGGGGVMKWFEQEFAGEERMKVDLLGLSSLRQLDMLAAAIKPGSDGVVFLPYMAGERSPIWDAHAKGVFYGLDFTKSKGHMVRAAMEGVAYALRHNLDVAESVGAKVTVLRAMGGSANSKLWTQIKSDITGKPVDVPSADTATTLGAALLAGVGTGVYRSFEEAVDCTVRVRRTHTPEPKNGAAYAAGYRTYRRLYENLKNIMNEDEGKAL